MPRYFFHVREIGNFIEDEEGRDLPGLEVARAEALKGARSIISDDVSKGVIDLSSAIEVADSAGAVLLTLSFGDSVRIERREDA